MSQPFHSPRRPIGLIGLGLLGSEFAAPLLRGGWPVLGYDIDAGRIQALQKLGGRAAPDVRTVFRECDRIILCLPTHLEVGAVITEAGPALRHGQVVIDSTTGEPQFAEKLAASLAAHGVTYCDATVSGSSSQLREGTAIIMVGSDPQAFDACTDLLGPLGCEVFHAGPPGAGAKMKLVTNVVLGLNRAALAEGLALARGLGLDAAQAAAIMRRGPAYSRIMDRKSEKMLAGNFVPEARLAQHLKDVRIILALGRDAGLPMPLSAAHCAILEDAVAAGLGPLDNSAIIQMLGADAPKRVLVD